MRALNWTRGWAAIALSLTVTGAGLHTAGCGNEITFGSGRGGGTGTGCPAGQTDCAGDCVDTDVSNAHCGACDASCDPGEICNGSGTCQANCQPGLIACDGLCIDPDVSNTHCGACDGSCEPGEICDGSGSCEATCQPGLVACDGVCVDPNTDEAHCGAGSDCATDPGTVCGPGELCDGSGTCALSCQSGMVVCDDVCTDPLTDNTHCGAGSDCSTDPGAVCPPGSVCNGNGLCTVSCQTGWTFCGTCVNPLTDPNHCGAGSDCFTNPGTQCPVGWTCNFGACQPGDACGPGQVECLGNCIDPLSNNQFCGAGPSCTFPGVACPNGHDCVNGACLLVCQSGLIDCNGTCTDPLNDEAHCGASGSCSGSDAGQICASGHICDNGVCLPNCPTGFVPCAGSCIDPNVETCPCSDPSHLVCGGNCVDPLTDSSYCGATYDCTGTNVGVACASTELCAGGSCCENCGGNGCCPDGQFCSAGVCIQPLVNASFETGDFTGWVTQDLPSPLEPLQVVQANAPFPTTFPIQPTDGQWAAYHGFDGSGGQIHLGQDIALDSGPTITLQFDYRAGWDNFGMLPRTFEVWIEPSGGGAPLQTTTILTAAAGSMNVDTGPLTAQVDLSAFAGQAIFLRFVWVIPESFTGPGGFLFDNVQIL